MQKNILLKESNKYSIKNGDFEGPLDLLCHLIDSNEMDIYDVNIDKITDQYMEYIREMQEMDLEVTSEFLLMASNLLYIKSKKLLPRQEEEEEMLTEEELIERIIEYKSYKEAVNIFRNLYEENSNRVFRNYRESIEMPKQELDENDYNVETIAKLYKHLLIRNENKMNTNAKNIEKLAIVEHYTVSGTLKKMFRELYRKPKFIFNKLFKINDCSKQEVVTAFTALLEMSRRDRVNTEQEELFGDITVTKKKRNREIKNS